MTADLHCHTSASDAALTRDELVSYAALCGLKRIAITDHDTMKNSFCTAEDEVEVVTGCEFSCFDSDRGNKKVHVLCYYPKKPQLFAEYFKRMSDERNRVGQLMIDKVKKIYPVINEQNTAKFTKDSGTIFKANFMQILSHYGVVKEIYGELYRELFSKSGTCTVEPQYGTLDEVLELIRAARGVAVIAHPSVYDTMEACHALARAKRIDGIEVFHPRNKSEDKEVLSRLCEECKLIKTGGSDYHGRTSASGSQPGDCVTDDMNFNRLLELSGEK